MADDRKADGDEVTVKTYIPNLWWRPSLSLREDMVKAAFLSMRERLAAAGCDFDKESYSSSDTEPEYNGPGSWALVGRLGWCLRSDNFLDESAVRQTVANLGGGSRGVLRDFLVAREAELATDPYLATKSRALRLQFAALGQEWFAALQGSPTLADYLEGEAQAIDLEAVLG